MTHRIRMARKRLGIARERKNSTEKQATMHPYYRWWKFVRRLHQLRAIERRKDETA